MKYYSLDEFVLKTDGRQHMIGHTFFLFHTFYKLEENYLCIVDLHVQQRLRKTCGANGGTRSCC